MQVGITLITPYTPHLPMMPGPRLLLPPAVSLLLYEAVLVENAIHDAYGVLYSPRLNCF